MPQPLRLGYNMKVLITTDLYTTQTNGVVTSVRNLYDELTKSGHDVRILTLSPNRRSRRIGNIYYIRSVSLERIYPNIRMPISYRHRLIRELIQWKPDVIHSQCEFFTMQYAQRISKRTGAPIVHTYHTLYEQYFPYLLPIKKMSRFAVQTMSRMRLCKVQRVIAPTVKVKSVLQDYGLKKPISIVPSGIDLSQHKQRITPQERHAMRQALGIDDDQLVLINLGRLGTEKNLEELVAFFAEARNTHFDLVFLIVGDGPAREQLEELRRELGLEADMIFTGMVDPKEVHKYYQLGDLFISASTSETQGLTFIEASANGLPLLCREDPCLEGVLFPGINGYTYTSKDTFLSALDTICSDPDWRLRAGMKSQEIAADFDKGQFGRSVEDIYTSMLA